MKTNLPKELKVSEVDLDPIMTSLLPTRRNEINNFRKVLNNNFVSDQVFLVQKRGDWCEEEHYKDQSLVDNNSKIKSATLKIEKKVIDVNRI